MENQSDPIQALTFCKTLQREYQKALLKSGVHAANLLSELLELKIMPDPRAKEMADVALEVIKLINAAPLVLQPADEQPSESQDANG